MADLILLFNPNNQKEIKLLYPKDILLTKNDAKIQ